MIGSKANKAIVAAASSAASAYFASEAHIGPVKALAAAAVALVVTGALTYGVPNGVVNDLAAIARQIEAAAHITNLVANTPAPTETKGE